MNKSELITCLRNPNKLSDEQLMKLEKVVEANPYFLSARLLLAKASKEKGHPETKKRVSSAAIYSTDRILLKKYLSGDLFFLSQPPKIKEENPVKKPVSKSSKPIPVKQKDRKVLSKTSSTETGAKQTTPKSTKQREIVTPDVPKGGLDAILEELQRDMENLKNSREKFAQVQNNIDVDKKVVTESDVEPVSKETSESIIRTKEDSTEAKKADPTTPETKSNLEESAKPAQTTTKSITEDALKAIEKAKQEVVEEDQAKQNKLAEEADREQAATDEKDKPKVDVKTPEKEAEGKKASSKPEVAKDEAEDIDKVSKSLELPDQEEEKKPREEKEERTTREPRFSRFSSRSYLSTNQDIDSTAFLDENDDSSVKKEAKTADKPKKAEEPTADKAETKKTTEKSEVSLPDLSKAKPVARKKPRKSKKTVKSKEKQEEKASKETSSKKDAKATEKTQETPKKELKKKVSSLKNSTSSEKNSTDDLISKFIEKSPTIKYQRKEESKAEDLSEESASWDPNLASEYLAEIYLHQGNKKRAIEIYEALGLKYPEKKSYFADLISKID